MPLNLGTSAVNALYLGASTVTALYLGSDLAWPLGGGMPSMRAAAEVTVVTTTTTPLTINAPAGTQVGDTIVHVVGLNPLGASPTLSAGWSVVVEESDSPLRMLIVRRTATGSDTLTITPSVAARLAAKSFSLIGDCTITASAVNLGDQNSASLNLGTSAPTLWVSAVIHTGVGSAVSAGAAPTSYAYSGSIASTGSGSTVHVRCHIATRELTAQTEDPGAFAQVLTNPDISFTLGIRTV